MWIDQDNFELLSTVVNKNQTNLLTMFDNSNDNSKIEFRVAYDDLLPEQKKLLPTLSGDFKVYTTEKSRPPKSLKDRVIKERLKPESPDIIKLLKLVLKENDREKVHNSLEESKISPIVFQIWLLRIFSQTEETCELLSKLEQFCYEPSCYFSILSTYSPRLDIKFRFPKKFRD